MRSVKHPAFRPLKPLSTASCFFARASFWGGSFASIPCDWVERMEASFEWQSSDPFDFCSPLSPLIHFTVIPFCLSFSRISLIFFFFFFTFSSLSDQPSCWYLPSSPAPLHVHIPNLYSPGMIKRESLCTYIHLWIVHDIHCVHKLHMQGPIHPMPRNRQDCRDKNWSSVHALGFGTCQHSPCNSALATRHREPVLHFTRIP